MRKKTTLFICLFILLIAGCATGPVQNRPHPIPTATPTPTVAAAAPTVVPTVTPIVIAPDSFALSKVNDLSGKYEFTFPGFFDKCDMSTDASSIFCLYSSTLYDDLYFVIIYEKDEQPISDLVMQKLGVSQLPPICAKETLHITLPEEFFKEAREGYCEAEIKLIMYCPASIDSSLLQFEITKK